MGWSLDSLACSVLVTFSCGVFGEVWYLIIPIHDLYLLTYFSPLNVFFQSLYRGMHNSANFACKFLVLSLEWFLSK